MASFDDLKVIKILADDKDFSRDWRLFCKSLGFGHAFMYRLEKMDTQNASFNDIIIEILSHWKNTSPGNANPETLSAKLREIGCVKSAEDVASFFSGAGGSPDGSTRTSRGTSSVSAEELIRRNYDYLTRKMTNIPPVLNRLFNDGVITSFDKSSVMKHGTNDEKSVELFDILMRKDLDINNGLQKLVSALKDNGNESLADKLTSN